MRKLGGGCTSATSPYSAMVFLSVGVRLTLTLSSGSMISLYARSCTMTGLQCLAHLNEQQALACVPNMASPVP